MAPEDREGLEDLVAREVRPVPGARRAREVRRDSAARDYRPPSSGPRLEHGLCCPAACPLSRDPVPPRAERIPRA